MSLWIWQTRDTALFIEREPHSRYDFFLREALLIKSTVSVRPYTAVVDPAKIIDRTVSKAYTIVSDFPASVHGRATAGVQTARVVRDTALVASRFYPATKSATNVRDVALLSTALYQQVIALIRETAQLSSRSTVSLVLQAALRDTAVALDRVSAPVAAKLRESALILDRHSSALKAVQDTRDTALLRGTFFDQIAQVNLLRDVAKVVSRASLILRARVDVREVAYITGTAIPPPYGRAYTCSVITWGMSTFENFPFLTMTTKYAAGKNLWLLGADKDAGVPISSSITTGTLDFGIGQLKRMSGVYAAGAASAPITVAVTGDVAGALATYEYPMELRDQTNYRNNRAVVGKGFRSRFVQVAFKATDIKYKLLSASIDVAVTERRI